MIRQALVLKLKSGKLEEYIYHHDRIPTEWPKLHAAIKESGIHCIRTFAAEPVLFLYAEVEDADAFPRLWDSEAHKEWAKVMDPLIELNAEMVPDARFITQIFNLET